MEKLYLLILLSICFVLVSCQKAKVKMFEKFKGGEAGILAKDEIIHFKLVSSHIIEVNTKINGSLQTMVLDTGGLTMLDQKISDSLGIEVSIEPQPGTKLGKVETIKLDKVSVRNLNTFIIDFNDMFQFDHSGMVGSDYLRFFQTEFDYQKQIITFRESEKLEKISKKDHLMDLKIIFPYFPTIKVEINGEKQLPGLIDTGLHYAFVLPVSWMDNLSTKEKKNIIEADGYFAKWPTTQTPESYLYKVNEMKMGDILLKDVPVIFAQIPTFLEREVVLIGKYFLENYITTLDYSQKKVMLTETYNNNYSLSYSTGLMISKKENKFLITGVWGKSPASDSGIDTETILVEINGKKHSEITNKEIMDILMNRGIEQLRLTIFENEHEKEILLKKTDLFI